MFKKFYLGQIVCYNIIMESTLSRRRRKTVSIQIGRNEDLIVKALYRVLREKIDTFILSTQPWINKHMETARKIQVKWQQDNGPAILARIP